MARMSYEFPSDMMAQLERASNLQAVAGQMLEAMAEVWKRCVRRNLERHHITGDLADSAAIVGGITYTADGAKANLGFEGVDRHGVSNDLKANVIEHGRGRRKRGEKTPDPFMTKTANQSQAEALRAAQDVLDRYINGG